MTSINKLYTIANKARIKANKSETLQEYFRYSNIEKRALRAICREYKQKLDETVPSKNRKVTIKVISTTGNTWDMIKR